MKLLTINTPDNKGKPVSRVFELSIDVGTINRVRAERGVNLGMPKYPAPNGATPSLAIELREDAILFASVLWSCVHTSAVFQTGSHRDIDEAMFIDAAVAAGPALYDKFREEWSDFFRRTSREVEATAIDNAAEIMAYSDRQMLAQQGGVIQTMMRPTTTTNGSGSLGNSPESADSTTSTN